MGRCHNILGTQNVYMYRHNIYTYLFVSTIIIRIHDNCTTGLQVIVKGDSSYMGYFHHHFT